jgi:DNA-3-methyladenine glycosylase II
LIRIILEQQVSLASARATFQRLDESVVPFTPERLLGLGARRLRALGITRQKAAYCLGVAEAIGEGSLDLGALARMEDGEAAAALMRLKGVGPWTAEIYLLMALRRPDVWPSGDMALIRTVQDVKRLRRVPSDRGAAEIALTWRPFRSVAARMLWQHYLAVRGSTWST